MSVEFANGQEVRLHLPGGVYRAVIDGKTDDGRYIMSVPSDNPVKKINGRNDGEFDE